MKKINGRDIPENTVYAAVCRPPTAFEFHQENQFDGLAAFFLYNFAEFSVFLNNIWNLSFLLLFLLCLKRCRFDVVNFDVFNRTSSFFKFVNLTRNGFAIKKCAHTTKIKILYSKRIQIKKFNKQTLKKKFNFSLFLCSAM